MLKSELWRSSGVSEGKLEMRFCLGHLLCEKQNLAKCETANTDLLSQFFLPRKPGCWRQYDSHSYLLSLFSYLVTVFFKTNKQKNSKDFCAPGKYCSYFCIQVVADCGKLSVLTLNFFFFSVIRVLLLQFWNTYCCQCLPFVWKIKRETNHPSTKWIWGALVA